jgi:hypothetical protein
VRTIRAASAQVRIDPPMFHRSNETRIHALDINVESTSSEAQQTLEFDAR